jgi:uncharacterized membrane protein YphA (DoxX/SURF4 family)
MRLFRHLVSWALALFLIAMFVQATIHPLPNPPEGSVKFFDPPGANIVFQTIADRSGQTLFEPAARVLTGVLELVAALFLLLPFTRRFGAIISSLVCGGAVAFHLSPLLGREVPLSLDPANAQTDGGSLFMLAIIMLVASLLVLVVHPATSD